MYTSMAHILLLDNTEVGFAVVMMIKVMSSSIHAHGSEGEEILMCSVMPPILKMHDVIFHTST